MEKAKEREAGQALRRSRLGPLRVVDPQGTAEVAEAVERDGLVALDRWRRSNTVLDLGGR
jgi:hypothetical protein